MDKGFTEYSSFIKEIKELIYRRQYEAMKKVNSELIQLYWEIGEEIDYLQRENGWANPSLRFYQKNFKKSFPASLVFRREIFGLCEVFM